MRSLTRKQLAVIGFGGLIVSGVFLCIKQLPIVRLYEGESIYAIIQMLIKLLIAVGLLCIGFGSGIDEKPIPYDGWHSTSYFWCISHFTAI